MIVNRTESGFQILAYIPVASNMIFDKDVNKLLWDTSLSTNPAVEPEHLPRE